MIRYTGRGTPIDRSRRIEWASTHAGFNESDVSHGRVGEDGILFSDSDMQVQLRSASLDSATRPSQSQRSVSPDWNFVCPSPSNMTGVGAGVGSATTTTPNWFANFPPHRELEPLGRSRSCVMALPAEPLPSKIKLDGLESDPSEWDSLMQTVLGSGDSPSSSASRSHSPEKNAEEDADTSNQTLTPLLVDGLRSSQIDLGVSDINLGDPTFNLRLGMQSQPDWLESLGLPPTRGRGGGGVASTCDSPSIYSTPPASPRTSRESQLDTLEPSRIAATTMTSEATMPSPSSPGASNPLIRMMRRPSRSGIEPSEDTHVRAKTRVREDSDAWWRKVLCRMQRILRTHHRSRL